MADSETRALSTLADLPLETFEQLALSSVNELTGFVPRPWPQILTDHPTADAVLNSKPTLEGLVLEATLVDDAERASRLEAFLDAGKSERLAGLVRSRKLDLARALRRRHNAEVGGGAPPLLGDFDWSVKWVLGDSSSVVNKYPLAKLDLMLEGKENGPNEQQKKSISMELTKAEIDVLLNALEPHCR